MINGITVTTLSNEGFQPKQESVHALLYNKNELHLAVDIVLLVVFAKKPVNCCIKFAAILK